MTSPSSVRARRGGRHDRERAAAAGSRSPRPSSACARPASGTIEVDGRTPRPGSVPRRPRGGRRLRPQDRHREGFVPLLSVAENATMTDSRRGSGRAGYINLDRRDEIAGELDRRALDQSRRRRARRSSSLSGGNQQKVVMARALASDPRVLVLMHPTAGVDVRSKETLLDVVDDVRAHGHRRADRLRRARRPARLRPGAGHVPGPWSREMRQGWHDTDVIAAVEGVDRD